MTLWTVALQAPLSVGFPRQQYWSGLPFPSPGHLLNPGIKPASPALQVNSFLLSHQGSPCYMVRETQLYTTGLDSRSKMLIEKKQQYNTTLK